MNRLVTNFALAALLTLAGCATHEGNPTDKNGSSAAPPRLEPDQILAKAATQPSAPFEGKGWHSLFDGKNLQGWRLTEFGGHGEVRCERGLIVAGMGDALTGIGWTNDMPTMNYEVALDAMRVDGSDFFCGLTFPVGESHCSFIVGGWGGSVTGLSSVDGNDASENETSQSLTYVKGRWSRIRIRVTQTKIQTWVDEKPIVDLDTTGRKISLRYGDIELSKPFGLATWQTTAAWREIKLRRLDAAGNPPN
jgi:Domain of Unknown Function (DUF1080)